MARHRAPGRGAALVTLIAVVLTGSAVATRAAAGAATPSIELAPFSVVPVSGPPGTVVRVSGAGCAPGLVRSPTTDFVLVSATRLGPSRQAPTAADGSWHTRFTVPAGAAPGATVVAALCFSNGLPSLLTLYQPATFTVTAPPPTTTPSTTTTTAAPGGPPPTTEPPGGPAGPPMPTTSGPSHPGPTGPSPIVSSPTGPSTTVTGTTTTTTVRRARDRHDDAVGARPARAAELSAPVLLPGALGGSGPDGWIGWILLALIVATTATAAWWLWRTRRPRPSPGGAP